MWERIFGALRAPGKTLNQVAEKNLWKEGLLIIVVVAILQGMSSLVAQGNQDLLFRYLEQFSDQPLMDSIQYSPAFTIFSSLFGGLLAWVIAGGIFFLFAKLFKGEGTFSGMLAGLGYASTPYIIGAPLVALASLAGAGGLIIGGVISFAVAIWVLVLNIIAIRESQQIGTGAAVATFLIPVVLLFILALILAGVIVAMLMTFTG
jgi:hypothetical protein